MTFSLHTGECHTWKMFLSPNKLTSVTGQAKSLMVMRQASSHLSFQTFGMTSSATMFLEFHTHTHTHTHKYQSFFTYRHDHVMSTYTLEDPSWLSELISNISLSLSLCSVGSRLSCCDVDDSAPQIPPLCHSGCFTNVCPRPFLYVFLPGSCWSPSASLPCSDPLDDGLFQAVVSDDVTKMFHLPFPHLFH